MRIGYVINSMVKADRQIETDAVLGCFDTLMEEVESALVQWSVERIWIERICLLVDEAVMNVIHYAYPGRAGKVCLGLRCDGRRIEVDVRDTGIPFDPTQYPAPDVTLPPCARPVGGLGIYLLRNMHAEMEYRREGECNHLVLRMDTGETAVSRGEQTARGGGRAPVERCGVSCSAKGKERDAMLLKVNEAEDRGVLVLAVEGRLHGADSAEFQEKIMEILNRQPKRILFDLSEMTRVDSMGLRAFIMTCNKVKGYGGRMALCGLQRIVEDVFDISGFSSFFTICRTREEALGELTAH